MLRGLLVCALILTACSGASDSPSTEQTGAESETRSLTVHIDAGFQPIGDGTECESVLAGEQVRLTDASGTIVGIAAVPATAPRSGSTKTGIGGINVGTCDVAVTIDDVGSTSDFYTLDLGVGTLDYTSSELDSLDWDVVVSAIGIEGVWEVEKQT